MSSVSKNKSSYDNNSSSELSGSSTLEQKNKLTILKNITLQERKLSDPNLGKKYFWQIQKIIDLMKDVLEDKNNLKV